MRSQDEIQNEILRQLYLYEFREEGVRDLYKLSEELGWDKRTFEKAVDRMTYDELISPWAMGGIYRIQVLGILEVERRHLVDEQLIGDNDAIRTHALRRLSEAYEEGETILGLHYTQIFPDAKWPEKLLVKNLLALVDLYYMESRGSGSFKITHSGLDLIEKLNRINSLAKAFQDVKDLDPHPRGREFQKLFSRLLNENGWEAFESVKTSHEEMDVIFSKQREYFLVECKWEKDPVEAPVVREVFGKISNRVSVNALVISMSGFTTGAVEQTNDFATRRAIMLFGSKDVEALFSGEESFDDMLDAKYRALVTKRSVVFK